MSALSVLYFVLPFPLVLTIHGAEEVAMRHRWMQAHRQMLAARFPKCIPLVAHFASMSTGAWAIATLEKLLVLLVVTGSILIGVPYAPLVWAALFMAFSIHLALHILQSLVLGGYVPGLVSSVLCLPYAFVVMESICRAYGAVELLLLGGAGVVAMAINLRLAHWLGFVLIRILNRLFHTSR